jgi:peptidoglycan/LPS O-acetylase OafA/YrhL
MRRIPALDGVRALAVLAVFAGHLRLPLSHGGWLGVDVFFVLSGYLITSILLAEHAATGRVVLGRFYVRRLLRLYPALLVLLAVGLTFGDLLTGGGHGYGPSALLAGTYTLNLAVLVSGNADYGALTHMWSLAVEEQFYLLWPPALILILRRGASVRRWAGVSAVVSAIVLGYYLLTTSTAAGATPLPYFFPQTRAYELLLGCALAAWLRHHPREQAGALCSWIGAGGLVGLALVADRFQGPAVMFVIIVAAGLLSCLLVAGLACNRGSVLGRMLSVRPAVALGQVSYGIYLWHLPVLTVVNREVHASRPWCALLSLALTVVIAACSRRWIERPFLTLKNSMSWTVRGQKESYAPSEVNVRDAELRHPENLSATSSNDGAQSLRKGPTRQ